MKARGAFALLGVFGALVSAFACSKSEKQRAKVETLAVQASASAAVAVDLDAGPVRSDVAATVSDVPIDGLGAEDLRLFREGDGLFEVVFREPDGLGPLSIRSSCGACHAAGLRGPGLVQKMALVEADGVTAAKDSSAVLKWGPTVRQKTSAGAKTPIVPPNHPRVKVTTRVGPPILGRGYMEAIADSEIERVEREQATRTDGIAGKINRVTYRSMPNPDGRFGVHQTGETNLIGRFGLKARIVSLDEFTADAFQGDMGVTTAMRPTEPPNPDGLTDDAHPGVDLGMEHVNLVAGYLRRIAIPPRIGLTDEGNALFARAKCNVCHVPSLHTRADYPLPALANIDAAVYTDMLVHNMGDALADGMTDGQATSRFWRTAPLIGLRFARTFLHDARVTNVEMAIRAHAGEALSSTRIFETLTTPQRDALIRFVEAL